MDFLDVLHTYFRGERLEAAFFIAPAGLAFLALAYAAWRTETGGFLWGALVPSVIFGLVLAGTGVGVAARTSGQVAELEAAYAEAPAQMVAQELPRMRQVQVLFSRTLPTFAVLAVLGLLLHLGVRTEWAHSLGAVLVAGGGVGLLIDGFASRRAEPYVVALEALAKRTGGQ